MVKAVKLSHNSKEKILHEISVAGYKETGGVLCGTYIGDLIQVESVSGPGRNAYQTPVDFVPDKEHIDYFLETEYRKSAGLTIYVGEWHSHPQSKPYPSEQDFQSFYERSIEWQYGELAFLIFGFLGFGEDSFLNQGIALSFNNRSERFEYLELQLT